MRYDPCNGRPLLPGERDYCVGECYEPPVLDPIESGLLTTECPDGELQADDTKATGADDQ